MTKTKKRFGTLAAAVIFAIALLGNLLFGAAYAKANDSADTSAGDDSENISLYYISDYSGSYGYFNGFISQFAKEIYPDIQLYEYQAPQGAELSSMLQYLYMSGYENIRNSFIIFELRSGIPMQLTGDIEDWMFEMFGEKTIENMIAMKVDKEEDLYTYRLCEIFQTLKENNCKIMTILGTDDSRLDGIAGDFLRFVDINVNLDVLTWFFDNYIGYIEDHVDLSNLDTLDLVFDYWFSQPWFFENYLTPYFIEVSNGDYNYLRDYWGAKVNIHMPDSELYLYDKENSNDDTYKLAPYNLIPYSESYLCYSDQAFPVGSSSSGSALEDWSNCINVLAENGYDVSRIYYYNEALSDYQPPFDDMYKLGRDLARIDYWLPDIVYDFLAGADLTQYNNYNGICAVSHIAIEFTNNGGDNVHEWRRPKVNKCFQRNMTVSEYITYYGYGD